MDRQVKARRTDEENRRETEGYLSANSLVMPSLTQPCELVVDLEEGGAVYDVDGNG